MECLEHNSFLQVLGVFLEESNQLNVKRRIVFVFWDVVLGVVEVADIVFGSERRSPKAHLQFLYYWLHRSDVVGVEEKVEYFEVIVLEVRAFVSVVLLTDQLYAIYYLFTVRSVEIELHRQSLNEDHYLFLHLLVDEGQLLLHECLEHL